MARQPTSDKRKKCEALKISRLRKIEASEIVAHLWRGREISVKSNKKQQPQEQKKSRLSSQTVGTGSSVCIFKMMIVSDDNRY